MGAFKRMGNAALAVVLACALGMPATGLAWASGQGSNLVAGAPEQGPSLAAGASEQGASLAAGTFEQGSNLLAGASELLSAGGGLQAQDVNAAIWDGAVDTSWYNTTAKTFTLTKPAQLAGLAAIVNGTADGIAKDAFRGKTVRLGADIALNAESTDQVNDNLRQWVPIGCVPLASVDPDGSEGAMPHYTDGNFFDGTFDGAGHVVRNIYIHDSTPGSYGGVQALFGNVGGHAVIQNLGLEGGFVYGRVAAGLVAISHSTSSDSVPRIIGCYNTATVECNGSSTRGAGGIFGGEEQYRGASTEDGVTYEANYHGAAYIANCYNAGRIFSAETSNCSIGGIAGTGSVQIFGCYNSGRVDARGSLYGGSIAGNVIGANYLAGQNAAGHPQYAASTVADVYALSGSIAANEDGKVVLYNLVDNDHDKGGKQERSPAVTDAETVKFKSADWFAGAEAENALSQSFDMVEGAAFPTLYWQQHKTQWDLGEEDASGYKVYELWGYSSKYPYTGSAITPPVTVTYYGTPNDEESLVYLHAGSDFTVKYADNVEIGTASVTVTGLGRFYGTQSTTFVIRDGNLKDAEIETILAQWWYGSAVEPDIVVRTGTDVLDEGEYAVSWSNNDPAVWSADGKATATVTVTPKAGNDKLSGSTSATFTILKASTGLDGAGTEADPYRISTKQDLQYLAWATHQEADRALLEKYCSADAHFKVMADIDATSSDATYKTDRPCDPLFTNQYGLATDTVQRYGFGGTIDGNGKTITLGQTEPGVSFDLNPALAFIAATYNDRNVSPVIKDLAIAGSVSCPHGAAAGFVIAHNGGTLTMKDCVNRAEIRGDAYYGGGAAGFVLQTSRASAGLFMSGCTNQGAVTSGSSRAGGFVSALGGQQNTFEDCLNEGAVTSGSETGAGGIVAIMLGMDTADVATATARTTFTRCGNAARVYVNSSGDAGGIVATAPEALKRYSGDADAGLIMRNCYNRGEVSATGSGDTAGGIIGRLYNDAVIANCYNTGKVATRGGMANCAGGLVGYMSGSAFHDTQAISQSTVVLRNVYSAGAMSSSETPGGLLGIVHAHTKVTLDNAYYNSSTASKAIGYNFAESVFGDTMISPPEIAGTPVAYDSAAMKTDTFVSQLGTAFSPDGTGAAAVNSGYPVLVERAASLVDIAGLSYAGDGAAGGSKEIRFADAATPWAYNGEPVRPQIVVSPSDGHVPVEGSDYIVFYTAHGTKGRATVQGIGLNYTGSRTLEFDITPCDLSACAVSQVSAANYADYAGGEARQDVAVVNPAGYDMAEGADYEVSYSLNNAAGTAWMRIEGLAPYYTGSVVRMFTIEKGDLGDSARVALSNVDAHYPLSHGSAGLYIYEQLTAASGYTLKRADVGGLGCDYVRYFLDSSGNVVKNASSGARATSLTKAGEYTVVLSANDADVVDGGGTRWTNANWTGKATAKFTYGNRIAEDATISGVASTYGYTGEPITIEPALVNKLTGYPMTKGAEYDLTFLNSRGQEVGTVEDAGSYTLVVSGAGNDWFGEERFPFTVVPAQYFIGNDADVEGIADVYKTTGEAVKPVPTAVKVGTRTLDPSTDYAVTYEDSNGKIVAEPTEAGIYYVVITGKGSYTGAKKVPFNLEKPFVAVYVRTGAGGVVTLAKAFTRDEFVALKSAGDPVSALYCETGGTNWHVATAKEYVTLADLLDAAGVQWGAGVAVSYGGDASQGKRDTDLTYEQEQRLMFYPATTATGTDNFGGVRAPFVLSITDASCSIGTGGTFTAQEAADLNVRNAGSSNAPRAIMGVLPADYVNASANAASMMGVRLWNHTGSITVTLPASDDPAPSGDGGSGAGPGAGTGSGAGPGAGTGSDSGDGAGSGATPGSGTVSGSDAGPGDAGGSAGPSSSAGRVSGGGLSSEAEAASSDASAGDGQNMYRLYNPYSGEHFYTSDADERNDLVGYGWVYEGIAWKAPKASDKPVHRLYNPYAGDHHYTTDASERDNLVEVGWQYEGIGWYSDDAKSVPLFRVYNPNADGAGAHHYTADASERDSLVEIGWIDEGVGWYGA